VTGRQAFALRLAGTLIVALVSWAVPGYFATVPLGAIFGWSGHPAIPAAPVAVYIGLYLVVLPALCLAGAWRLMGWAGARIRGAEKHVSG
jgi:hypothetical protein